MEVLASEGYSVAGAGNGLEALDYLRRSPGLPALILLDVMMPVMSGAQFRTEQMKNASWSAIPVVLLTAMKREEIVATMGEAQQVGMDYLRKPIDLGVLLDVVARSWSST